MRVTNTTELREMLINTIEDVRAGKLDYKQAGAISSLTGRVLQTARIEMDFAKHKVRHGGAKDASVGFIGQRKG